MAKRHGITSATLLRSACADLVDGLYAWRLWTRFAWHDMLARYRRSWVGPIWLILTAAVFVAGLSLVYSTLFQMNVAEYVPFVAIGFVTWGFVSAVSSESVMTFVEAESFIRQIRLNLFVYVLRVVWRNVIVFAHQFVVVLVALVLLAKVELRTLPLAVFGIFLLLLQAVWITPLLALVGTRFRDLQPIIGNLLQVLFFVTPILWFPSLLGSRRWIADFNPLHSLIAVVREPLLGSVPAGGTYVVVSVTTAVGFLLAMLIYGRFRFRVVYWL